MKNSDPEDQVTIALDHDLDVINSLSVDEDALQSDAVLIKETVPYSH